MDVTSFVHFIRPDDMSPPTPSPEAEDLVSYLNEAWTPYHAVLASCKRLLDAGFKVRNELLLLTHRGFFFSQSRVDPT